MEDPPLIFTIGHHDLQRPLPITAEAVASANASGYDILTSPITTPHFHSRVLALLSNSLNSFADTSTTLNNITSSSNASPFEIAPLAPADTTLTPNDTIGSTIGIAASWIDLGSSDPIIADLSRQVLRLELAYAAFCGLSHVIIPGPRIGGDNPDGSEIVQYAHAILEALSQGPFMTIYIWLPMIDHAENAKDQVGDLALFVRSQYLEDSEAASKDLDLFGTWQAWDIIRSICRYSTRLYVALSLPKLLPPTAIQSRWFSEPVRILTLSSDIFVKNAKGYPVLSKAHQAFVLRLTYAKQPAAWLLLSDVGPVPTSSKAVFNPSDQSEFPSLAQASNGPQTKDLTPHLSYMRNLQMKAPQRSQVDAFTAGYQDYLQVPLQPLTVNLESITYEVFEKDPVKYEWYGRAVARALHDWIEQGKPTSNPDGRVVVAVVGAGRGPLVTRALQASEAVGVEIDLWALEKNPNAFVLLQRHNETFWRRKVNLVKSDMRTWPGPVRPASAGRIRKLYNLDADDEEAAEEHRQPTTSYTGSTQTDATYLLATATHAPTRYKIDIVISELLGSFADNELSPECLDGIQHLLSPTHGISIPASYTAHLTPIAAPKLHADISLGISNNNPHGAEVPYVVMFNAIDYLSTEESVVEHQQHPNLTSPTTNRGSQQQQQQPPTDPPASTLVSGIPAQPVIRTAWSFHHPNPHLPVLETARPNSTTTLHSGASNAHNARHSITSFSVTNRGTCHGLAGYFESVLYPGVELSTNPTTMPVKSGDMISWFPIFFPLKVPLYCPDESLLKIQMWRRTDDRKVWYEWIIDVFVRQRQRQQQKEKLVRVAGSELHSSEKEACLM